MKERFESFRRRVAMIMAIVMIISCLPLNALADIIAVDTSAGIQFFSIAQDKDVYVTYNFVSNGANVDTQIVNQTKEQTPTEPETPAVADGKRFDGWYIGDTKFDPNATTTYTENTTVTVNARFTDVYYVYFLTTEGDIYSTAEVTGNVNTVTPPTGYEPKDARVVRWVIKDTENEFTSSTVVTADTYVEPVTMPCVWVTFDTMGGTGVDSKYQDVNSALDLSEVTKPTKTGYTFGGWSRTSENQTAVGNSITLADKSITLYAIWTPADVKYTIVYWGENANDEDFGTYLNTQVKTAKTGSTVKLEGNVALPQGTANSKHFKFKNSDSAVVEADGSTVINAYFERKEYKITFNLYTNDNSVKMTIGGKTYDRNTSPKYEIIAKFEQDISALWPTADNFEDDDGFFGWNGLADDTAQVSKIVTMTDDLCSDKGKTANGSYNTNCLDHLYYMFESFDQTSPANGNERKQYYGKYYDKSTVYSQDANSQGGNWSAKSITGLTSKGVDHETLRTTGNWWNEKAVERNVFLYYDRIQYTLTKNNYGSVTTERLLYGAPLDDKGGTPDRPEGFSKQAEFKGWYTVSVDKINENTKPFNFSGATLPVDGLGLFAYWVEKKISVTLNVEIEGDTETWNITIPAGTAISSTAEYNEALEYIAGKGLTLLKWVELNEDGIEIANANPNEKLYTDAFIKAVFQGETKTVTYQAGEGTGADYVDPYKYGVDTKAEAVEFAATGLTAPAGKVFAYWTVNGNVVYPGQYVNVGSMDVVLTANYVPLHGKVTITYHANFGSDAQYTTEEMLNNAQVTLSDYEETGLPLRDGYTFDGWASSANAEEPDFEIGTKYRIEGATGNDVYAVWEENLVTINYIALTGGSVNNASETIGAVTGVAAGSTATADAAYKFVGWYDEACTTKVGDAATFVPAKVNGMNVAATYYAKFELNEFNVTYAYTGTVPTGAPAVPKDEQYAGMHTVNETVPVAPSPTLDGYTFSGWTTSDATISNGSFTMPANDVKLTGFWTKRTDLSYKVEYYWKNAGYQGTDLLLEDETKTVTNQTFGDMVTESPKVIDGYTVDPNGPESITITIDDPSSKNVIKFYYYKNVELTANGAEKTYNGLQQSVQGYTGAPAGVTFEGISASGSGKDVSEYDVTFSGNPVGKLDTKEQYIVTKVTPNKLLIKPAPLTITTGSATKPYDGKPLTNSTANGTGFVNNEGSQVTITATGSQTLSGSSNNTYTIDWGNVDSANYVITDQLGVLTVTPIQWGIPLEIVSKSDTVTFDATVHSIPANDAFDKITVNNGSAQEVVNNTLEFTMNGVKFTVEGLSAGISGKDVGEYPNTINGTPVIKDAYGNNATGEFRVILTPGVLKILPALITVSGTKTWVDNNNQDGKRPASITINLLANGKAVDNKTVTADAAGNWSWSFENINKYDGDQVITYTITEDPVAEYETVVDGFNVTNTHEIEKTSVSVKKVWNDANDQDGIRPDSITVQLYKVTENGTATAVDGKTLTLSTTNNWADAFTDLPVYEGGKALQYSVKELNDNAPIEAGGNLTAGLKHNDRGDYTVAYSKDGNTLVVTNTHTSETVNVTVNKSWANDDNLTNNVRPASIQVQLYEGDAQTKTVVGDPVTIQASENGVWTYTWQALPKYRAGELINYTADEVSVPVGYDKTSVTEDTLNTIVVTNTLEQFKVNYRVAGDSTDKGTVSIPSETVKYNQNAAGSTATANTGYHFVKWTDAEVKDVSADATYGPTNVTADATYYAHFEPNQHTVTYSWEGDVPADMTVPDGGTHDYASNVDVAKVTVPAGYVFTGWTTNNVTGQEQTYAFDGNADFAMPNNDVALSGVWSMKTADLTITGTKNYNGPAIRTFEFELYEEVDGADVKVGENKSVAFDTEGTAYVNRTGTFQFALSYDALDLGMHTYKVKEVVPAENPVNGITYDTAVYTFTVNVEDTGAEDLTVTTSGTTAPVFTNNYNTTGSATFSGTKSYDGPRDATFTFELYTTDESFGIEGKTPVTKELTFAAGREASADVAVFTFDTLNYTTPGTYYYVVKEKLEANDPYNGIDYDNTEYKLTVTAVDNKDGTMAVTVTGADGFDKLNFTNTYSATGSWTPVFTKQVHDANVTETTGHGNFDFTVERTDANNAKVTTTAISNANGSLTYADASIFSFSLEQVGEYTYTFTESAEEGYIEADSAKTVTVTVADNGDGTLNVEPTYDSDDKIFDNYKEYTLTIKKKINWLAKTPAAESFNITYTVDSDLVTPTELTAAYTDSIGSANGVSEWNVATLTMPYGASVTVTETLVGDQMNLWKDPTYAAAQSVKMSADQTVTVVNEPNTANLTITKTVSGDLDLEKFKALNPNFKLIVNGVSLTNAEYKWEDLTISDNSASVTIPNLEIGAYTVTESGETVTGYALNTTYTVDNASANSGAITLTAGANQSVVINNTYTKDTDAFQITVKKQWDHKGAVTIPTGAEVKIERKVRNSQNDWTQYQTGTVLISENDTKMFSVPRYEYTDAGASVEYEYRVTETGLAGYESDTDYENAEYLTAQVVNYNSESKTVEIKNVRKTTSLTVTKTVVDTTTYDNQVTKAFPVAVTLNGTAVANGSKSLSNREPTLTINGLAVGETYTITETVSTDAYTVAWNGVTAGADATATIKLVDGTNAVGITNTRKTTTVPVTKTWTGLDADAVKPDVTYTLKVEETVIGDSVTVGSDKNWEYTFGSDTDSSRVLPPYTADGVRINYVVEETAIPGYTSTVTMTDGAAAVVNTYTGGEKKTITGRKVWVDGNDVEGKRPASITINLKQNDDVDYDTTTATAENGWTWSFTDLPTYNTDGTAFVYTVSEKAVPGYTTKYEPAAEGYDGAVAANDEAFYTITNTINTIKDDATITVTKNWDDETDYAGLRPLKSEFTVTLTGEANGTAVTGATRTISGDDWSGTGNTWTKTVTVRKYDDQGNRITYTAGESIVDVYANGSAVYNGTAGKTSIVPATDGENLTVAFTNTYNPTKTSVTAKKVWVDDGNAAQIRPENVTLALFANGVMVADSQKTAVGDETLTWDNLQKYAQNSKNATEIAYTVREVVENGTSYTAVEANGRIASTDTTNGRKYVVTYSNTDNAWTVTNTLELVSVTVNKEWIGGEDPTGVSVGATLMWSVDGGKNYTNCPIGTAVVTLGSGYTHTWNNLPKYVESGSKWVEVLYKVEETTVPTGWHIKSGEKDGVAATGTANIKTATLTNERDTASLVINKKWITAEDVATPSVKVNVMQNGVLYQVVDLTEAKGWTETLTNVPTHDVNGNQYTYTLAGETAVSEADASNLELYTVSYSNGVTLTENGSASLTATNTLNDGTAYHTVTATKTWVNNGVHVEYPSVDLQLTSDIGTAGTQAAVTGKVVTVNGSIDEATTGDRESAAWTATYTNIPKYVEIAGVNTSAARGVINGFRAIVYDVTEGTAPTGYTSDESAQLAVTNTRNLITDNSLKVTKTVENYTEAMAGDTFTVQIQLPEDIVEGTTIELDGTTQTTANVQTNAAGAKYIEISGVKHGETVTVTSAMPTGTYVVTENNANADANNKFEYERVSVANADLAYIVTNKANEGDLTLKKIVKDSEFVDGTRTFNIVLTAPSGVKPSALTAWAAEWNKDRTNAVATASGNNLTVAMTVTGTAALEDSYEVTLTSLPNGTYSVVEAEESSAGYSVVYSATSAAVNAETTPVVTVTNTRQDNSLSIQVTKNWEIPGYVQENLGKATLTLERSVDNTVWESVGEPIEVEGRTDKTHTWEDLEKYNANGQKYTYRVVETYAHENVKVYNGTEQELTANEGKYNQVVTNGTVTFVNKFKLAAENALTVKKVIADNVANGLDNKANFEITVQRRNPDVAETAENAWVDVTKVTLGNIEPAKLSEMIGEQLAVGTYRACELSVNTDVWTPSYSEDVILNESNRGKLSVTNTRKLLNEDGKLSVTKIWLEANGKNKLTSHIADEKVVVNLYRFSSAEAVTKTPLKMELTEAANWAGIFEKLPATDAAGNPYTYTVKEVDETGAERAEGDKAMFATATAGDLFFEVTIDQENTAKGYTITNKLMDQEPDKGTEKTADVVDKGELEAEINDTIEYTIKRASTFGRTTTATVVDKLPDGLEFIETLSVKINDTEITDYTFDQTAMTWTIDNVPPMGTVTVKFSAAVTEDAVQYDEIKNTASVNLKDEADGSFKDNGDPEDDVIVDVLAPDLKLTKTLAVDRVAVEADETFAYMLTVTNRGNGRATNVVVTDMLPEQVVAKLDDTENLELSEDGKSILWTVDTVEAGESVSVTFDVTVKSEEELDQLADGTMIVNTAKITDQPPKNPNTPDNPDDSDDPDGPHKDTVTTPIFRLDIDKTARVIATGEYPDADNDPNTASLGDIIEFKVTVKNLGGIAADNIVVEDLMLGKAIDKNIVVSELVEKIMIMLNLEENQLILPRLEPGKKVEFTYQYKVTEADILAGSVNNVATVTAQNPDSQDDPIVESDETKNQTDPATPSMIFDKAITNDTGKPYGFKKDIAYMLTITNTGNVSLTDVVIVDDMTSGADPEDRIIELEKPILPGETVTVEYTYTVQDGDLRPTYKEDGVTPAEHPIDNKATVTAMATNDEVISVEDTAHAMAEQWYHIIFVDSRTNEVIEYIDIPYGGRVFEVPEPPYHRGYDFIRWTDWQGENITFNQVVYALYERDTETIFDARIPLAGGYISNVGDCFD